MTQTIISGTLTGVLVLIAGTLITRLSLRTSAQGALEELERRLGTVENGLKEHSEHSEERNELVLQSLLAIMLTLKKREGDARIDAALDSLNDYIIHKGSK